MENGKGKTENGEWKGRSNLQSPSSNPQSPFSILQSPFSILIASGLVTLLLLLPAGAQNGIPVYLPFVARDVSPASWPIVPTPTPPPTPRPSPTAGPIPTATPAPVDVRIVSSSAFTKTLGAKTFLFIVGEVANAGPDTPVRDINIIAALLDDKGEPIRDVSESAYQPVLAPGETTVFRMMTALPAGYTTHTLHLDYHPTSETPPPAVVPSATNTYTDESSGWQYFLGEFSNTTGVNMTDVQAVVALYDEAGHVINVADSGRGANSLYEDVIGPGQKRPFRTVLRHGPSGYASSRWQIAYRTTDGPAPIDLPIRVGYAAQSSDELRNENGEVIGLTRWLDIYGEVQNTTQMSIRAVRVYGTFYGEDGEVINAGQVQSLHGRRGMIAPGESTPFHLNLSSGLIPDVDTPRRFGVTYVLADGVTPDQTTITGRRAYWETRSMRGTPVEWLNVVGEVRNDEGESLRDVQVVATFYDEVGHVVNAMAGEVFRPTLPAGQTSPFRLRTASGPLAYDHFTLDVTARPSHSGERADLVLDLQAPPPGATPAVFQGEVRNESNEVATGVAVFVALYNAESQILAAEYQLVAETVPAGAAVPFTLRIEQGTDGWQTYDADAVSN